MAGRITRRGIMQGGMALAAMPWLAGRALAAEIPDPRIDLIHPDLRPVVPMMQKMAKTLGPLTRDTLKAARERRMFAMPALPDVPWEQRTIPGASGQPDVTILIVNARPGTHRPAILHTHGGGFIIGRAAESLRSLQETCRALDCVAVSVDYRLAPETTYAGSIEDNYAGLKWLHANAESLGADPARIAVAGESAGGGHAALLAITARDRGEVPLVFQCLTYPMLDDRTGTSRAMPGHVGWLIWTAGENRLGWESFLGSAPGGRHAPKGAVPARVESLAGLPPAFIGVGALDLFCDEDTDYARRLNDAAVPTELIVVPGAFHGFDMMPGARIAQWFAAARLDALRRGLGQNQN